jgi:hypothetical protein
MRRALKCWYGDCTKYISLDAYHIIWSWGRHREWIPRETKCSCTWSTWTVHQWGSIFRSRAAPVCSSVWKQVPWYYCLSDINYSIYIRIYSLNIQECCLNIWGGTKFKNWLTTFIILGFSARRATPTKGRRIIYPSNFTSNCSTYPRNNHTVPLKPWTRHSAKPDIR